MVNCKLILATVAVATSTAFAQTFQRLGACPSMSLVGVACINANNI